MMICASLEQHYSHQRSFVWYTGLQRLHQRLDKLLRLFSKRRFLDSLDSIVDQSVSEGSIFRSRLLEITFGWSFR